ncbi:MAG TPA: tyrosine-type recombinase/integrase [Terriglobia bacterium]|nr:tyrosine-type recombinase/integrase [Terriglobia bacterium]
MQQVPVVTIFVRHSPACPHQGDEFYKRCSCWKHLRWSHGGRQHRKAAKSKTWAGAERAKKEIELSYENAALGKPAQPNEAVSVERAIQLFLKDKEGQNMEPVTLRKYRRELGRFQAFCDRQGRYFLQEIGLPDLTEFRSAWEEEYPSSLTRQKVQERLRAFFKYALNAGFIPRSPAAAMSTIKVDVTPTLPLTAAQYKKLLEAVPEVFTESVKAARVHTLIRFMRCTGLAIGDTVTLEREKVKLDSHRQVWRVVTSRAKTGVDVSVPIPADVAQELVTVANGNPKYVFWNSGVGQAESAVKKWHKDLRAVFIAAGLPEGHPHQLRDTAAVEWLKAGIPVEEVSRLLGHASIKTTEKHYAPWVKSRQDRLDDLVMATWRSQKA